MKKISKILAATILVGAIGAPIIASASQSKAMVKSKGGWEYQSNAWKGNAGGFTGDSQYLQYHEKIKAVSSKAGYTPTRTHRYRAISNYSNRVVKNGAQDPYGWAYHNNSNFK
ncbi:hypothetical protein [uncultured Clostridium sp.]|jgi:hypothetical protein|uniref:hypothetical protein n=1 Tax=uncultured Clostridium sp. TaxID=59620 RepID=UPI002624C0C6|nr:hypothetical protein [uncultured Clostridium sp.]